jgi:hypothetical protein
VRKRSGRPPRYAAIPNETIDNAVQLDFMALGLLNVLLRHRDGWDITLAEIGAKYGYGRDAMANAMGLLQVARYVVKIRLMSTENNQWSTEVCVYDTPATDAEVAALLAEASKEPDVRVAQVIEPTRSALESAAKRRSKLHPKGRARTPSVAVPRVPENPHSGAACGNDTKVQVGPDCRDSRQSGDPAVFKKTVDQKTEEDEKPGGDGRRPSAGSRAERGGGFAASGKTKPDPLTREQRQQVDAFFQALPKQLAELVPANPPRNLKAAVLDALAVGRPQERTPEQLVTYRLLPKWDGHYASRDVAGPLERPVGVLIAMLRRDQECQDDRCDERTEVDTGQPCRLCALRAVDKRAERAAEAAQERPQAPQAPQEPPPEPVKPVRRETRTQAVYVPQQATITPGLPKDIVAEARAAALSGRGLHRTSRMP